MSDTVKASISQVASLEYALEVISKNGGNGILTICMENGEVCEEAIDLKPAASYRKPQTYTVISNAETGKDDPA